VDTCPLAYGHSTQTVTLPFGDVSWLLERELPKARESEEGLLRRALERPLGTERLARVVHPDQSVAIVVSDLTRPCPTARILPFLLSELERAGVAARSVHVVFALGGHRCLTVPERASLLSPAIYDRVCCEDIGAGPFVDLGRTRRGTPIQIYQPVVEADWRIYVGNIEYHYFAGYTGGAKALLPGVSSPESIRANHSWMVHEEAAAGRLDGNPVREDMEEAASRLGPTFLLNVVLDADKRIVEAVAGDLTLAHRQGCRRVDELYRVPIERPADIVLASAGGWPKDINLYQAHKALENAARAVRDGGILILVAECPEGLGNPVFAEWMTSGNTPDEMLRRIREHFVLGGHKAAAIAKTMRRRVRIFLVSAMAPDLVTGMGLTPFATAQEAMLAAQSEMGQAARWAALPHAGSTLPSLAN
jgi:nickel-dependent lactate racemase